MSSWYYDFGQRRARTERNPALEAIETLDELAILDDELADAYARSKAAFEATG